MIVLEDQNSKREYKYSAFPTGIKGMRSIIYFINILIFTFDLDAALTKFNTMIIKIR